MVVLLTISLLAFVALLWATFSIAGFVRRARRRRQRHASVGSQGNSAAQKSGLDAGLRGPDAELAGSPPPPPPQPKSFSARPAKRAAKASVVPAARFRTWSPLSEDFGDLPNAAPGSRFNRRADQKHKF